MGRIKTVFFILFYIQLSVPFLAQENSAWFPDISYFRHLPTIQDYISTISSSDQNIIRGEYFIMLDFLSEVIAAYHENIETLYSRKSFYVWHPVLLDGNLTFIERKVHTVESWDIFLQEFALFPCHQALGIQVLFFLETLSVYNFLIDFWYSKTGELLRDHLDQNAMAINLAEFIRSLQEQTGLWNNR